MKTSSIALVIALATGSLTANAAQNTAQNVYAARVAAALDAHVPVPAGFAPIHPQMTHSSDAPRATSGIGVSGMEQVLNKAASSTGRRP